MSGEMIAIVAVGVALAGVILTATRGLRQDMGRLEARLDERIGALESRLNGASRLWNLGLMRWSTSLANCASAWRTWKGCWKDYARPSPGGSRPARAMMEEKYPEDATEL